MNPKHQETQTETPSGAVSFTRGTLYLCEDRNALAAQLGGAKPTAVPEPLCDNISTDEITPGWVCFWYDQTLGRYALVGLRNGGIQKDSIKNGDFEIIVSGQSKGCGSSRETAPYAERAAGIRLVVARSIEKIYGQNCQNIGLLTSTDFGLITRIERGEAIPLTEFTAGLDPISAAIVKAGGLFAYNRDRVAGTAAVLLPDTAKRPMTAVEKIIARHMVVEVAKSSADQVVGSAETTTGTKLSSGIDAVRPGDAGFCLADVRFSHDYVTPMAAALFAEGFGDDAKVRDPCTVFAFRDHLTFLSDVISDDKKKQGLLELADNLAVVQREFCAAQDIRLYDEIASSEDAAGSPPEQAGSVTICHNAIIEEIGLPGQLIAGTDSHTCTAGAIGAFAFGVGATDMANAWFTHDIRVTTPATVRIEMRGTPRPGVVAKDAILALMAQPYFKNGDAIGKVLEFCGEGMECFDIDERANLTNMAVEPGATTGFVPADRTTIDFLQTRRSHTRDELEAMAVSSDAGACFAHEVVFDLGDLEEMVATPGDPRNGVPVASLLGTGSQSGVPINIAYGGSCTGGKCADMEMYAEVLSQALDRHLQVKSGVQLFIQFGSQEIKRYAEERGLVNIFERAGAKLIAPSCGACINAGPGVSKSQGDVTVSAINRNFPGRSGPGKVYLASPMVVAASAIAGYITTPRALFGEK